MPAIVHQRSLTYTHRPCESVWKMPTGAVVASSRKRASLRATARAASRDSLTSRRMAAKNSAPSSSTCEIEASASNRLPSARRPWMSRRSPMRRAASGETANSRRCRSCSARVVSGSSIASGCPITCAMR